MGSIEERIMALLRKFLMLLFLVNAFAVFQATADCGGGNCDCETRCETCECADCGSDCDCDDNSCDDCGEGDCTDGNCGC